MKICGFWSSGDISEEGCVGNFFKKGIERVGFTIDQHYPSLLDFHNLPKADIVIANGFRYKIPACAQSFIDKGKPAFIYDLGYIGRAGFTNRKGYYQLGINQLGWLPDFKCPPDRFENLGIKLKPIVHDENNKRVLICAQKPNDPQHNLTLAEMKKLMEDTCKEYTGLGFEVIFRSHPADSFEIDNVAMSELSIEDELNLCSFMVTYNSTSGVEALLSGKPVVALSETAHYYEISSKFVDGKLSIPSMSETEDYFNRLAYAQWELYEISTGLPFIFLLNVFEGNDPFSLEINWCSHQSKLNIGRKAINTPYPTFLSNDSFKGLKWGQIKAKTKRLTGITPKNKEHLEQIMRDHNESLKS